MSLDRTDGFTTIEAIVAIAIVAAAGAIMAIVSGIAIKSLAKTGDGAMTAADCLMTDTALRTAVGRVRIPWWESRVEIELSPDSASVLWFDGMPESALTLSIDDGHLVISGGPESNRMYRSRVALDGVSFRALTGDNDMVRGIEITYTKQNTVITCAASFASFAMGKP